MSESPTETSENPPSNPVGRNWVRWVVYGSLVGILFILVGSARQMNANSEPVSRLGVTDGQLASCPDSPNCVSTQAHDDAHLMAAIPWEDSTEEAMNRLKEVVQSFPRTHIVTEKEDYLHVEFQSLIFRFVDDVELWVDPDKQVIHFRSASRIGYSDLGANRKRMSAFVTRFNQIDSSKSPPQAT